MKTVKGCALGGTATIELATALNNADDAFIVEVVHAGSERARDGILFISWAELEESLPWISFNTIRRAMRRLEGAGVIRRVPPRDSTGVNGYYVKYDHGDR